MRSARDASAPSRRAPTRRSSATTSPTGSSPYVRVRERRHVGNVATRVHQDNPRPRRRADRAPSRGSSRKPDTSLTIDAPAASASLRDARLHRVDRDRHAGMIGSDGLRSPAARAAAPRRRSPAWRPAAASIRRRCRSTSAPSATSRSMWRRASSTVPKRPPSLKLSGVTLTIPRIRGARSESVDGRVVPVPCRRTYRTIGIRRPDNARTGAISAPRRSTAHSASRRSRRARLRSAEQRRIGPPRLEHRRRDGRRRRRRHAARRPRRQRVAARQNLDVVARQRLALEQRRGHLVQQVDVRLQRLPSRARTRRSITRFTSASTSCAVCSETSRRCWISRPRKSSCSLSPTRIGPIASDRPHCVT